MKIVIAAIFGSCLLNLSQLRAEDNSQNQNMGHETPTQNFTAADRKVQEIQMDQVVEARILSRMATLPDESQEVSTQQEVGIANSNVWKKLEQSVNAGIH